MRPVEGREFVLRDLALRELEPPAGFALPGLLAFDASGVTGEVPGTAERGLELGVGFEQGAGYAETNGAGLAGVPAAADVYAYVPVFPHAGQFEGRDRVEAVLRLGEEVLDGTPVDEHVAAAGQEPDARDGRLPATGADVYASRGRGGQFLGFSGQR